MDVEVLIPFRGGCAYRERNLRWLIQRWPWRVTVATTTAGPWSKARALMPAVELCSADVLVVADADVWCDDIALFTYLFAHSEATWGVPHRMVHRLSDEGTSGFITTGEWRGQPLDRTQPTNPHAGTRGGGIVVAYREVIQSIPMDPRFEGWGQEDQSWAAALWVLAGRPMLGSHDLVHLWHPEQPRLTRKKGSARSWALWKRYNNSRDPRAMAALVEEARDELRAH